MLVLAMGAAFITGGWLDPLRPSQAMFTLSEATAQAKHPESNSAQFELLPLVEKAEYRGSGRNIFMKLEIPRADPPQPPSPPKQEEQQQVSLPVIGLRFFGFATRVGSVMRAFLAEGDDVFVAGEGEIVNRRYRIVRISPSSVEIEDVLTNHSQNIPLTQG